MGGVVDYAEALLAKKVREHCESGVRRACGESPLLVGCGNAELVFRIVKGTLSWVSSREKVAQNAQLGHSLAYLTACETRHITRNDFSWNMVCDIVESAGRHGVYKCMLDNLAGDSPQGAHAIQYSPLLENGGIKSNVTSMAKAILWLEAYTFLIAAGYQPAKL